MTTAAQRARSVATYFQPPAPGAVAGRTVLVIDTLRATTVITTLIARGAAAVYPCASVEAAREMAAALPGSHLCGEVDGLPVEGFEFENSPVELARLDVRGWTLVQSTSNGTRALAATSAARRTLVACLRNRTAAAEAALAGGGDIALVCAGEEAGSAPSVEDAYTAGAIIDRIVAAAEPPTLRAGARLALRLYRAYGSAEAAFADSAHADDLRALGFEADLRYAAEADVERCVPAVGADATGRMIIGR